MYRICDKVRIMVQGQVNVPVTFTVVDIFYVRGGMPVYVLYAQLRICIGTVENGSWMLSDSVDCLIMNIKPELHPEIGMEEDGTDPDQYCAPV